MMRWACLFTFAMALSAAVPPLEQARERLARGDAIGASRALASVPCPPVTEAAARTAWLDARARIAWHQGRLDEAFALSVQAIACAEAAGATLPPCLPAFEKGREWVDASSGLPVRLLPVASDPRVRELAEALANAPEASGEAGAWVRLAARLLDPTREAVQATSGDDATKPARRRLLFLQAALAARAGDADAAVNALRACARESASLQPLCQWFEAEAILRRARPDPRLAALRLVQSASALDASPWLRAAALGRAADALEPIDPAEAARLRRAALEETP
jgi:hypothetical protein